MKFFSFSIGLGLVLMPLLSVNAQTVTPPAECYRRCTTLAFEEPELANEKFIAKLNSIREQKKLETDSQKLKRLNEEEDMEKEKLEIFLAKTCKKVCKYED